MTTALSYTDVLKDWTYILYYLLNVPMETPLNPLPPPLWAELPGIGRQLSRRVSGKENDDLCDSSKYATIKHRSLCPIPIPGSERPVLVLGLPPWLYAIIFLSFLVLVLCILTIILVLWLYYRRRHRCEVNRSTYIHEHVQHHQNLDSEKPQIPWEIFFDACYASGRGEIINCGFRLTTTCLNNESAPIITPT